MRRRRAGSDMEVETAWDQGHPIIVCFGGTAAADYPLILIIGRELLGLGTARGLQGLAARILAAVLRVWERLQPTIGPIWHPKHLWARTDEPTSAAAWSIRRATQHDFCHGRLGLDSVDEGDSSDDFRDQLRAVEQPPFPGNGLHQLVDHRQTDETFLGSSATQLPASWLDNAPSSIAPAVCLRKYRRADSYRASTFRHLPLITRP